MTTPSNPTKVEFTDSKSLAEFLAVIIREGLTHTVVADYRYAKSENVDQWTVYLTGGF